MRMKVRSWSKFTLFLTLLVCAAPHAAFCAATTILPHRASYVLSRSGGNAAGVAAGAEGEMIFEWSDTCDGWATLQRAEIRLTGEDGPTSYRWSLAAWESKDGRRYRYVSKEYSDGRETSENRGMAQIDGTGKGRAVIDLPERRQFDLPPETLFPTAHSLALIERAKAGAAFFSAQVFDGSIANQTIAISAAISGPRRPGAEIARKFPPLAQVSARRVDFAYYLGNNQEGLPDYEESLNLYDNGIVDDFRFDFAGIPIAGKLAKLEPLKTETCR